MEVGKEIICREGMRMKENDGLLHSTCLVRIFERLRLAQKTFFSNHWVELGAAYYFPKSKKKNPLSVPEI